MEIGRVLKPQGIRGEVKIAALTDDPSRFELLKSADVGGRALRVEKVRVGNDGVYVKFAGVDDRNAAELLRGKFVSVDRAAAVPLEAGEFYIADLIGAELRERGKACSIGIIKSVESFGAADVVTVELTNGKNMSFAFTAALDAELDEQRKILSVDGKRLGEVAVYED